MIIVKLVDSFSRAFRGTGAFVLVSAQDKQGFVTTQQKETVWSRHPITSSLGCNTYSSFQGGRTSVLQTAVPTHPRWWTAVWTHQPRNTRDHGGENLPLAWSHKFQGTQLSREILQWGGQQQTPTLLRLQTNPATNTQVILIAMAMNDYLKLLCCYMAHQWTLSGGQCFDPRIFITF